MKVAVDVYTKDVDAALAAFRSAVDAGATDVRLFSVEDYESKQLEHLNLTFDADHTAEVIGQLDHGPFKKYADEL